MERSMNPFVFREIVNGKSFFAGKKKAREL
jgi:hypothetical protein